MTNFSQGTADTQLHRLPLIKIKQPKEISHRLQVSSGVANISTRQVKTI